MSVRVLGVECMLNGMDRVSSKMIQDSRGSEDLLFFLYLVQIRLKKGKDVLMRHGNLDGDKQRVVERADSPCDL